MGTQLKLLVYISFICLSVRAEIEPDKFKRQFELYRGNPAETPSSLDVSAHKNSIFVFVTGIAGEYIPLYWNDAVRELERLTETRGVKDPSKKRVFVIKPSSRKTVAENAVFVKSELDKILLQVGTGKKIVLSGHSMGAAEAWTVAMQHPEFTKEKMAGVIFLQGPFLGSPLANHIVEGHSLNSVQHWTKNPPLFAVRWGMLQAYSLPILRPALESITTDAASRHTQLIQAQFGAGFDSEAQAKTLFLTTQKSPLTSLGQIRHPLDLGMDVCVNALNQISPGPNDGLVELKSQRPAGSEVEARSIFSDAINHGGIPNTGLGRAYGRSLMGVTP